MKLRVGMGMGMVERSGYGYTHFWVWPNIWGMGMGRGGRWGVVGGIYPHRGLLPWYLSGVGGMEKISNIRVPPVIAPGFSKF